MVYAVLILLLFTIYKLGVYKDKKKATKYFIIVELMIYIIFMIVDIPEYRLHQIVFGSILIYSLPIFFIIFLLFTKKKNG